MLPQTTVTSLHPMYTLYMSDSYFCVYWFICNHSWHR